MKNLSIIVAMTEDQVIGYEGKMPWNIPEDLKHFKQTTLGHTLLMGRKTFDSIGRVLPGRRTIVITRNLKAKIEGAEIAYSVESALELAKGDEIFVVGGADLYEQLLPFADRMYVTLIRHPFKGDKYFPKFDWNEWKHMSFKLATTSAQQQEGVKTPIAFDILYMKRRIS